MGADLATPRRRVWWRSGPVAALVATAGCGASGPAAHPTFTRDVAPIVFAHCAPCHRPGGPAPFSLLTYADAAGNAEDIVTQVRARHMPPWLPDRTDYPILGERRLTDEQIGIIERWVADGAVEGRPRDLPAAPVFTDGWQLGTPDAVLTVDRPYEVRPGGDDIYRNLIVRTTLPATAYVRAVEFKTNGAPIHHAVIRVDPTSASRRRDGEDGAPGFDGMAWGGIQDPDGHFIGWAPGRGPIVSPDGMPWTLARGADLVIEVHLIPPKTSFPVQPTIGLFFTDTPPAQSPLTVKMGSKLIDIPAGVADYVVTDTYTLPVDVDLLSVYPHAHYLGREMHVTARFPDGAERTLLHIPHWSFHWQQDYRYAAPIPLPRGTRLTMRYVFDNSAANPLNPNRPPARVQAGPRSVDEMAELGLQFLPRSRQDAAMLGRVFAEREAIANLAMAESRVQAEPDRADYRALLGGIYVEVGRPAEALPHLQAALRLGKRSSAVYNDLGIASMAQGRAGEAVAHFRRAEALAPGDENVPFNLGNAFGRLNRPADAIAAYERAIAINPDFVDAHVNLAIVLSARGRTAEAFSHYERAIALRPDSAVVHSNYGGALAAAGRFADALRHTRRALEIEPGYPPAVDNLRRLERMGIR